MVRVAFLVSIAVLLSLSGCPTVSLDCAACASDDQCAPQGLRCLSGRCRSTSESCPGDVDGGVTTDAGVDAGPDAGPDAGLATLPAPGAVPDSSVETQDDFEQGLSVGTGKRWSELGNDDGGAGTLTFEDGGRAGKAAVFRDTKSDVGDAYGVVLRRSVTGTAPLYSRAWVRTQPTPGYQVSLESAYTTTGADEVVVLDVSVENQALFLQSLFSSGFVTGDGGQPWNTDWHVVESALTGLGTADASVRVWVDGRAVAEVAPVDTRGQTATRFSLGAEYSAGPWVGAVAYDDVAVTRGGPPAGTLRLVRPSPLQAGCLPVRVELHDDLTGALARAVRAVSLSLSGTGVAFFADEACLRPADAGVVAAGDAWLQLWVLVGHGQAQLRAGDLAADLTAATDTWQVP